MDSLIYFILLALLAEILGTIGGFGSSLFFVPIASYFLDFHSVLGITALFHVLSNLTKIGFFHKGVDKKILFNLGIPAVVSVIIGSFLSRYVSTRWLEMGLALFLIGLSLIFLIFKNIVIKPTQKNGFFGGVASGFIAGLIGTGGAIRGMVLAAFNLKMEVFIATSALIDLAIDSSRSIVYGINGFIHKDDLYLIPFLLVSSILGTYIGKIILGTLSETTFKKIVLILIFATGLLTIIKALKLIL